ncbi:hypothetical protein BDR22DRAFT_891091 [Usnea florida]
MSPTIFPSHLLSLLLLSITTLATDLDLTNPQGLAQHGNQYNLKCSNAPTVVAGSLLNNTDVSDPLPDVLPPSGSDQPWFKYLWCVPGTTTYLFLNTGRLEPPPLTYRDVRGALNQAAIVAAEIFKQHGDEPIYSAYNGYMTPGFDWYVTPPATNFQVWAASKNGVLTWGALVAALEGLKQFVGAGYDMADGPIVFQVGDGGRGEVAIGYVGFIDPGLRSCVYENVQGVVGYCKDVAAGKVIN